MPLQEIYYIAEMVVGLAVIISIIFVAIELRQNTYMMRKSMANERTTRTNWVAETICTDSDFRDFHRRIGSEWDQMTDDELYRAHWLGVRTLRPLFNELTSYFDGQVSDDEFESLRWNLQVVKSRPHFDAVYQAIKPGYPKKVIKFWEKLDMSDAPSLTQGGLAIKKTSSN